MSEPVSIEDPGRKKATNQIPASYSDPARSGLTLTVKAGSEPIKVDFPLTAGSAPPSAKK